MAHEKRIVFQGGGSIEPLGNPAERKTVFLLSPANMSGPRSRLLFATSSKFELASRLRESRVTLAEIFGFVSPLYFRGKFLYAQRFAESLEGVQGIRIITPAGGLMLPDTRLDLEQLRTITEGDVDESYPSYRGPLDRDAAELSQKLDQDVDVALLGSIATSKYVQPLLQIFGRRLVFPQEFVGRGDMSRGGLLLRSVRSNKKLTLIPVLGAVHHGKRPPKLEKSRK
jgi:hypothetical protein